MKHHEERALRARIPALQNTILPTAQQKLLNFVHPEEGGAEGMFRLWSRRLGEFPFFVDVPVQKRKDFFDCRAKACKQPVVDPSFNIASVEHAIKLLNRKVEAQEVFPKEARGKIRILNDRLDDAKRRLVNEQEQVLPYMTREYFNENCRRKLRDHFKAQQPFEILYSDTVAATIGTTHDERSFIRSWFQKCVDRRQHLPEFTDGSRIAIVVDLIGYREREAAEAASEEAARISELDRKAEAVLASIA